MGEGVSGRLGRTPMPSAHVVMLDKVIHRDLRFPVCTRLQELPVAARGDGGRGKGCW